MRTLLQYTDNGLLIQTGVATILPGWWDFDFQVGATLSLPITWLDETKAVRDLSTATVSMPIRGSYGGTALATWATGAGGVISVAATGPNIQITVPVATTAAYTSWPPRAIYAMNVTIGTTVTRLLEGFVRARES